jgi:hypothetical protein
MYDFFGLGQPTQQPHHGHLALENAGEQHQGGWEPWAQVPAQEELDMAAEQQEAGIDLNFMPLTEGGVQNIEGVPLPDLNMAPKSMVVDSVNQQDSGDDSVNSVIESVEEEIVADIILALLTQQTNFQHLEILPEDLHVDGLPNLNLNEANISNENAQEDEPNDLRIVVYSANQAGQNIQILEPEFNSNTMQLNNQDSEAQGQDLGEPTMIGMALLPENLHVDLGLADYISRQKTSLLSGQQPDGVRLWAKHFALVGNMQGLQVPQP